MGTIITILLITVCILLILIVLVQNSKGGGLSSSFASSNQVMGVRKTADFLEKATWTLAIALLVLCLASAFNKPANTGTTDATTEGSVTKKKASTVVPPAGVPMPTAAPENTGN